MSEELLNMMRSLVDDKKRLDDLEDNLMQLARSVEVIQDQMGRVLVILEKFIDIEQGEYANE